MNSLDQELPVRLFDIDLFCVQYVAYSMCQYLKRRRVGYLSRFRLFLFFAASSSFTYLVLALQVIDDDVVDVRLFAQKLNRGSQSLVLSLKRI